MGCYAKVSAAFFINSNCRRKTASPTLSSRPERSAVEGPAVCSIPPTQEPSFLTSRWVVAPWTPVGLQDLFAQAQRLRRDLDQFVFGYEFDCLLKINWLEGDQADGVIGTGGAHGG